MPNHCHNDLWVSGKNEDVEKLLAHVGMYKETPKFDFNTILPYPKIFEQMDQEAEIAGKHPQLWTEYKVKWNTESDGYNSGGYEWCNDNWGTEWNSYNVTLEIMTDIFV